MSNRHPNEDAAAWVSLLSVPLRRIRPHFWTFSVCFVATLIFYIYVHVIASESPSWQEAPSFVMSDTARAAALWLFASPIAVEGSVMVFAELFRQKLRNEGREEGRAEGREEGREEANAAWRDWNSRRQAAIDAGKPFEEPTPDAREGTGVSAG